LIYSLGVWRLAALKVGSQRRKIYIFQDFVVDTLSWQSGLSPDLSIPPVFGMEARQHVITRPVADVRAVGDGIGFGQAGEAVKIRGPREKEKIDSTADV
jgi:hypothetical protein